MRHSVCDVLLIGDEKTNCQPSLAGEQCTCCRDIYSLGDRRLTHKTKPQRRNDLLRIIMRNRFEMRNTYKNARMDNVRAL